MSFNCFAAICKRPVALPLGKHLNYKSQIAPARARRVALVVPGYIEALHVTARTDLVAFVPLTLETGREPARAKT